MACEKASRRCVQDCFFRFKLVKSVSQRLGGHTHNFSLSYGPRQTWLPIPETRTFIFTRVLSELITVTVSFVCDSGRGLEGELIELATPPSHDVEIQSCGANATIIFASEDDVIDDGTQSWNNELSPEAHRSFEPTSLIASDVGVHENLTSTGNTNRPFSTPPPQAVLSPLASSQVFDSPATTGSLYNAPLPTLHRTGSRSSIRQQDLPFSAREASLLRNYIENLSPWVSYDVVDCRDCADQLSGRCM